MIFELLVSSARICAYTSATPGACAVAGSATSIKQQNKNAQTLATFPPPAQVQFLRFSIDRQYTCRLVRRQSADKEMYCELLPDVFLNVHGVFGAVDIARGVRGEAFGPGGIVGACVGRGVGHEILHGAVFRVADANAAAAAGIVAIAGFALARLGI